MTSKKKSGVLEGHQQIGKSFIPPMLNMMGNKLNEVPWVKLVMPELIWIAELEAIWGVQGGTELARKLCLVALESSPDETNRFVTVSDYSNLNTRAWRTILDQLRADGDLSSISTGLHRLQLLYPKAPFEVFFQDDDLDDDLESEATTETLNRFKTNLTRLFDKTTREAIFVQGTAIYLIAAAGKLFIKKGMALADLPLLEDYPNTERSRMVAAAVRASIPSLFVGTEEPERSIWANYFWNRGLVLEKCKLAERKDGG
ncbi:MAG: hypothetical protein V3W14_06265 [Candidatus Neomarinimicrobiota bacterium]